MNMYDDYYKILKLFEIGKTEFKEGKVKALEHLCKAYKLSKKFIKNNQEQFSKHVEELEKINKEMSEMLTKLCYSLAKQYYQKGNTQRCHSQYSRSYSSHKKAKKLALLGEAFDRIAGYDTYDKTIEEIKTSLQEDKKRLVQRRIDRLVAVKDGFVDFLDTMLCLVIGGGGGGGYSGEEYSSSDSYSSSSSLSSSSSNDSSEEDEETKKARKHCEHILYDYDYSMDDVDDYIDCYYEAKEHGLSDLKTQARDLVIKAYVDLAKKYEDEAEANFGHLFADEYYDKAIEYYEKADEWEYLVYNKYYNERFYLRSRKNLSHDEWLSY